VLQHEALRVLAFRVDASEDLADHRLRDVGFERVLLQVIWVAFLAVFFL